MAVLPSDLRFYQSLSNDSLGGGISTLLVPQGINLFFNDIDEEESEEGSVAYRCFYFKNDSLTEAMVNAGMFIYSRTPNPNTYCELGLGTSGVNGVEQTIESESIAPAGVSFFATGAAAQLPMGAIPAEGHYPIWIKRVCTPNAPFTANDNVIITITEDGGGFF